MQLPDSSDAISSFEVGYKLTEELIKRNRKFTAIMAFDDLAAFASIRALSKAGIRVPEQCSVIGFDDIAPAALYTPALTHGSSIDGKHGGWESTLLLRGSTLFWRSGKSVAFTGGFHRS